MTRRHKLIAPRRPAAENYLLPSGAYTGNSGEYVAQWRALCRRVEAALPGWECYAFDPDLSLRRSTGRGGLLELPVDVAQRIAELVEGEGK